MQDKYRQGAAPAFGPIYRRAVARKGGEASLRKLLPKPRSKAQLARIPDDRWLAEITRRVFCAGFVWKIIEHKWPNFEKAFKGFKPMAVAQMSDEALERLASDSRIVRNYLRIKSVRENALFVLEVAQEHGSFGRFIADWPADDIVGLCAVLKKRGSRLGGMSGQYLLRFMGKDTFLLSTDVITCLNNHGVISTTTPSSKRDLEKIQLTFNQWHLQTGLPLSALSRIASCAVD
jgi:3-methyladenine DNA glycosylase Tag